jgi:MFS family permease
VTILLNIKLEEINFVAEDSENMKKNRLIQVFVTVLPYHSTTLLPYHCTTVLPYYCTTLSLQEWWLPKQSFSFYFLMNRVSRVIFTSLLIDLLAFTMILPLFPRILDFYSQKKDPSFDYILSLIQNTRIIFHKSDHMDIVLFGGLVGSMFSFLQFIVSPFIGKASDLYGRKRVLMVSMIGNLLSMLCWILAEDFKMFLLSRIIGGLTEGNVQLSIAMISDISTPKDRSRGLVFIY